MTDTLFFVNNYKSPMHSIKLMIGLRSPARSCPPIIELRKKVIEGKHNKKKSKILEETEQQAFTF